MMKKILINVFWGLLVVGFWLYQVFWPLFWNPISKFYGMVALYSIAAIAFGFAVRATMKGLWASECLSVMNKENRCDFTIATVFLNAD